MPVNSLDLSCKINTSPGLSCSSYFSQISRNQNQEKVIAFFENHFLGFALISKQKLIERFFATSSSHLVDATAQIHTVVNAIIILEKTETQCNVFFIRYFSDLKS